MALCSASSLSRCCRPGRRRSPRAWACFTGDEGGLVTVHGLATFAWDARDEAGRRLAAVQLVRLRRRLRPRWRGRSGWIPARSGGGIRCWPPMGGRAGAGRRGPKGASKLTPELVERITGLDAAGGDAARDRRRRGVHVQRAQRAGPGRVRAARGGAADDSAGPVAGDDDAGRGAVPVLPDPVPREGERVSAGGGCWARAPHRVHAGCPVSAGRAAAGAAALQGTGLLEAAREVYGGVKDGLYGHRDAADRGVPGAGRGAAGRGRHRVPPAALGRVLGLDRAPEVKTIRRKWPSSPPPGRPRS